MEVFYLGLAWYTFIGVWCLIDKLRTKKPLSVDGWTLRDGWWVKDKTDAS